MVYHLGEGLSKCGSGVILKLGYCPDEFLLFSFVDLWREQSDAARCIHHKEPPGHSEVLPYILWIFGKVEMGSKPFLGVPDECLVVLREDIYGLVCFRLVFFKTFIHCRD